VGVVAVAVTVRRRAPAVPARLARLPILEVLKHREHAALTGLGGFEPLGLSKERLDEHRRTATNVETAAA
jgi:hypothetical protein